MPVLILLVNEERQASPSSKTAATNKHFFLKTKKIVFKLKT